MNVIKLILTLLLLTFSTYSFGQFGGLKKPSISALKNKKPAASTSSSSNSTATSSAAPVESNRNKDGTPKRDTENPTYQAYSKARDNIRFAMSTMDGIEWKQNREKAQKDATKYLAKAKESLDFLNQQASEKGQAYLKEMNENYTTYNNRCIEATTAYNKKGAYEDNLRAYSLWVNSDKKSEDAQLDFSPKGFYQEVANYKKDFPEAYEKSSNAQRIFQEVDSYFKKGVYAQINKAEERADVLIDALYKKQKWEGHHNYEIEADYYLRELNKVLKQIPTEDRLEDASSAEALKAKVNKETALLQEYIDSGKLKAALQQRRKEQIDAVRLNPKGMSNSTYEKMALDRKFNDGTKVLRAVIVSSDWQVVKNGLDIPKHKSLWYSLAIKDEDGVCYKAVGELRKDYEGGGKYGAPKFLFSEKDREMNCDNVNK